MMSLPALIQAQWHLEVHTSSQYPFYFSNSGHSIPGHTSHHFSCFSYQKMSQYLCSSSTKAMVENGKQKNTGNKPVENRRHLKPLQQTLHLFIHMGQGTHKLTKARFQESSPVN
jgi:hypothetical protein